MNQLMFKVWVQERWIHQKLSNAHKKSIFSDNTSRHKVNDSLNQYLDSIQTEVGMLPSNSTHLCQPADYSIIRKIKTVGRALWDKLRMDIVTEKEWVNRKEGSGKLINPEKKVFLKLAASFIKTVSNQKDAQNVLSTCKEMIWCGWS